MVEFLYFLSFTPLTLAKVDPFSVCPPQPIIDWLYFGKTSEEKVGNKPKMAYSRDLPKMARLECGIMA